MNAQDIIIPKKYEVKVADRSYMIGTLSLAQIIELSRWFVEILPYVKHSVLSAETNIEAFMNIVSVVNEEKAADLYCIFLKETDRKFVTDNVLENGALAISIVSTICDANDFGKLIENFIQTVATIKKTMPKDAKMLMASLPSSLK
jgi:hypothetical protein